MVPSPVATKHTHRTCSLPIPPFSLRTEGGGPRRQRSEEGSLRPGSSEEVARHGCRRDRGVKTMLQPAQDHASPPQHPCSPMLGTPDNPGPREAGEAQSTFCIFTVSLKCYGLVIELNMDCVIGLKEPLNLEGSW